jgi:hypothetical protein
MVAHVFTHEMNSLVNTPKAMLEKCGYLQTTTVNTLPIATSLITVYLVLFE